MSETTFEKRYRELLESMDGAPQPKLPKSAVMLIALLEAEMFGTSESLALGDMAYRRGWNDRATSIVRMLRGES